MDAHDHLSEFLQRSPRGTGAQLARRLGVHPVLVSQWAAGTRPIPEDRAPDLERETGFVVLCEQSCPNTRWFRVPDENWPHGRPLIDKATPVVPQPAAEPAALSSQQ
jgi:DNA-binding transcriptional regulator YdaS (Cro superfamily)